MAERLHYFWYYIAFKEANNSDEIIEDAKSIIPDFPENNRSQGLKKYRHHLAAQNPDFQLVWDIHDAYKHYELGRSNANITHADQSGKIPSVLNETCDDLVIPIDDISAIWIRKKDGTLVSGKEILTNALAMWSAELARTGL
ncbi:hypothetical protein AA13595_0212 [Gluconacetobacter johannae DSM 13595]|uniref:Uncharacterized protein n=1 Tax=Gluconacetobacter johannae TaxID=112140 RepID=A0A7W4J8A9_9PROT|nr:hypothetical protein [Gluconacetobacter johannae]MBB2176542.1 hypothetical protein [Gluconacetobacter johannae]GBQ80070.1 hypothetical protein AA13595_0212 [Gluconacetobacter johannae DSM 13595]